MSVDVDTLEVKEITENLSLYTYMSFDGIVISSEDPIVGEDVISKVLTTHSGHSLVKTYPYVGERLENYHINPDTGVYLVTPSHWVVHHVDVLRNQSSDGALKEIVVAWCKKEPIESVHN